MATPIAIQTTPQGILIPNAIIRNWGEIEVLKEQDRIIIQPKSPAQKHKTIVQALKETGLLYEAQTMTALPEISPVRSRAGRLRAQIVAEMKATGLIEDLFWAQPPDISLEERASLAKKLSYGKPLSEVIIEDREDRV